MLSVARRAKTIFENSSDIAGKREFLDYVLQNPTVNGKRLEFSIASPFNLVLELVDCSNWLRDLDREYTYLPRLNIYRRSCLSGHRLKKFSPENFIFRRSIPRRE
ncbi:MAG: hypothetical protein EXS46_01910 [Candidatus Taylorbacteria bacterium]|nr:hypothetical protein [Candidatus Taylorbacteria bacterium]